MVTKTDKGKTPPYRRSFVLLFMSEKKHISKKNAKTFEIKPYFYGFVHDNGPKTKKDDRRAAFLSLLFA